MSANDEALNTDSAMRAQRGKCCKSLAPVEVLIVLEEAEDDDDENDEERRAEEGAAETSPAPMSDSDADDEEEAREVCVGDNGAVTEPNAAAIATGEVDAPINMSGWNSSFGMSREISEATDNSAACALCWNTTKARIITSRITSVETLGHAKRRNTVL